MLPERYLNDTGSSCDHRANMSLLVPPHEARHMLHGNLNPAGSGTEDVHFVKWRQRTLTDLATIFGNDSRAVKDFDRISYELAVDADTFSRFGRCRDAGPPFPGCINEVQGLQSLGSMT